MKQLLLTLALAPAMLCLAANAPVRAQSTLDNAYTQPADIVDGIQVGRRISRSAEFDQDLAPPTRVAAAHKCRAGAPCERHSHIH
jgi:hypothetical protein